MMERIAWRMLCLFFGSLCGGLLSACAPARTPTLVDLTYAFDEETIYWPTNKHFQREKTDWGMTSSGYWYASANFSASSMGERTLTRRFISARGEAPAT